MGAEQDRWEVTVTTQVQIRLCSALTVETADRTLAGQELGSRKARTLIAMLAAARGRPVPLDRVIEQLWPDGTPADPAANVATLVSRSRRLLGDDVLRTHGRAYALDRSSCSVDLDDADALVAGGQARLGSSEPALAAAAGRRALELLGAAPALPEEPDAEWVLDVRRESDELRRRARHLLAEALILTDPGDAVPVAAAAVAADPLDEQAVRDLMRAHVAQGSVAAALAAYDALAGVLRDELGVDPAAATAQLHLSVLREEPVLGEGSHGAGPARRTGLVGRGPELAALDGLWAQAVAGRGRLVVVEGEAGIGKTRLLGEIDDLAESTGGLVLHARCHPAERSLFLQPFVDALRPFLLGLGAAELTSLVREHGTAWVGLLPELEELVDVAREPVAAPVVERRRAYDAVVALLVRISGRRPLLLSVDDLQDAGAASIDLLAHLAGRVGESRVLLVGAVRAEDQLTLGRLRDRAEVIALRALSPAAVGELAAAAGLPTHAQEVMARTEGHALSVVEYLRALATDRTGVPDSFAAAVAARLARLAPDQRDLVQAASVLGGRIDPRTLAGLAGLDELVTARGCELLAQEGLLHRSGPHYELVNDLTQECVHASLAPAVATAYHRRAADLLSERPETMAAHAYAAGELGRAARGWLLAGRAAMTRSAAEDAVALFDQALVAAEEPTLRARVLLARALAHEAATAYRPAFEDLERALALARDSADRRLEMASLRGLGGDVPVALRLPMADVRTHLERGLRLASGLGDRRAEADFTGRLTVLEASRLQLTTALARAEGHLTRVRATGSVEALPLALDGVKTVLGYLGDGDRLHEVVTELVPLLREERSTWLLQWALFESAFVPASRGDWDLARLLVEEALVVNRTSGFRAYAGYFRAHLGWFARLSGDLGAATVLGRRAVADTSPVDHPWWYAASAGLLAGTLLERGAAEEVAELACRGLVATGPESPEAWRLRCLAPLAAAGVPASDQAYVDALELLDHVESPSGTAWVPGADCYLWVARAAGARNQRDVAERVLGVLREAVGDHWVQVRERVDAELVQIRSATS